MNLWGVVRVTKSFLPLIRKGRGRVVNVASISGRFAPIFLSAYAITKFGVEAFSDVLRLEMARFNVNVSIIEPGCFMAATEILSDQKSMEFCWLQLAEPVRKDYGDHSANEVAGMAKFWSTNFSVNLSQYCITFWPFLML